MLTGALLLAATMALGAGATLRLPLTLSRRRSERSARLTLGCRIKRTNAPILEEYLWRDGAFRGDSGVLPNPSVAFSGPKTVRLGP